MQLIQLVTSGMNSIRHAEKCGSCEIQHAGECGHVKYDTQECGHVKYDTQECG